MGVGSAVVGVGVESEGEGCGGGGFFGGGRGRRGGVWWVWGVLGINAMGIEKVEKDPHVFQPGIHTLPIERHHSVRRIPQNDYRVGIVIRRAFYRYKR